jgi:Concanavalin A-like lectin/glucanases superfamily/Domain of unknown function (DUF1929)/Bacterial Ig domain
MRAHSKGACDMNAPSRGTLLAPCLLLLAALPAHAAVGIDVKVFTDRSTSVTSLASPSFSTVSENELLLAFVGADGPLGTVQTVKTVSGAGLTWTLVVRANGQPGTSEIWRAFAPAPLANVTVTATLSQSAAASLTVLSFTGVDPNVTGGIGATGRQSAASGAAAASLVTTRGNSWVFGVGSDWDQALARAVPPDQTLAHQYLATVGDTYWVQHTIAATPAGGTTVTIADTAPTTDRYNLAVCEVLALSTSSDTTAPAVTITAPSANANVTGAIAITADASDDVGVSAVQFRVDGVDLLPEATAAPYSVTWNTSGAPDGSHVLTAVARDAAGNAAASAPVAVTVVNTASTLGVWSDPFELGMVAVNMVLMHTGKVLMMSGSFQGSWAERVWDPVGGAITQVPNPYYNVFCSGHAQLPDGRILVVGGYDSAVFGAANANIFDPPTQTWSAAPNMAYRRWYPTATTLPDGRVLVTSGGQTCPTCLADLPEIFDPSTNTFAVLRTARLAIPYYPFVFVLPDGGAIEAGATEETFPTSRLDVGAGSWTTVDPVVREGHSAVMYRPGKILKTGTAADSGTPGNAGPTAFVLDATQTPPAWRQVASMANPRAFQNSTLLPDGTVLVTGGGTTLDGHDISKAVYAAELWSPDTERWRTIASASIPRLYHSTALLLPDGRVLSAGGGDDVGAQVNETQGQIFSPPYLFKGARPVIASAPDVLRYGSSFTVSTPDAASIASVSLVRPGSVTHAFDQDQRYVPLTFTAGAGSLTVQAPANANLAPPGYYMLFLVNSTGVPSIAAFVQFAAPAQDVTPPSAPTGLLAQGAVGTASLTWNASSDDTGVATYNVYRSTTSGTPPGAATLVGHSTSTTFTNAASAGMYYYVVTAQDVAGNVSPPSNEASTAVLADTTPPAVAMTAPASQSTVSGSIPVSATASDDVGVAGVQFQLDGNVLGVELKTPPYTMTWNTAASSNGPHTVSAVARDAAGNLSQASVDVTVSNTVPSIPGLVGAYGFNEATGVQTHDSSGQGNTGTIAGATWTPNGKYGAALSFNGSSAWVTIADANSLDLTTGMTLEAWVNPSAGSGWRSVILKEDTSGLAYALYSANNASRPAGYVHTTTDMAVTGTSAVALNTWTHVAVTYNGATLRMYVNGTLVRSTSVPGAAIATGGPLRIGGNSVWGEYFKGAIDEVRLYNRALSVSEIQSDMNTPIQ